MVRGIPVGDSGLVALVDDEDYELVSRWKWKLHQQGYACRGTATSTVLMHRFLMGEPAGLQVDHKNRRRLDNQRSNLRIVTGAVNTRNRPVDRRNTSGVLGVSWDASRGKWKASTKHDGKQRTIGRFVAFEDAVAAREAYMAVLPGALASAGD